MRMLNVKKMANYKIVEQSKLVSNRHFMNNIITIRLNVGIIDI